MGGVSGIISSIVTFISTSLMNYFYKTITTVTDNSNISLYMIPVILGIVGSVLLISYHIFSKKNRDNYDKRRYFSANTL